MPGIQEYRQKVNTPEQTSLSCFGARYAVYLDRGTSVGEAGLSIWLSVDPLSDKYPSLSAYNYCALNPVMLVDPDGRDIFEVDQTGNVVNRIADQSQDVVRVLGEDGKPIDDGKVFAYGTIDQVNVGNDNVSVLSVKGDGNGEKVFEYLAENVQREFGLTQTGDGGDLSANYVSTGCHPSSEPGSPAVLIALNDDTKVRRHVHSHPKNIPYPSGLDNRKSDIGFARWAENKFRKSCINFQIYTCSFGYIDYHSGSTRNEFVPVIRGPEIKITN